MTAASAFFTGLIVLFLSVSLSGMVLSLIKSRSLPVPLLTWRSRTALFLGLLTQTGVAVGAVMALLAYGSGQALHIWLGVGLSAGFLCTTIALSVLLRVRVYTHGVMVNAWHTNGLLKWKDVYDYVVVKRGSYRYTFFSGRIPERTRTDLEVPDTLLPAFQRCIDYFLDARYDVALALRSTLATKRQTR